MTTYQDVMQAIRGGVDAETIEAMIADDKAALTSLQMESLRSELSQREDEWMGLGYEVV